MRIRPSGVIDRGPDLHRVRIDIRSDFVEQADEVETVVREEQIMARANRWDRQLRMKASRLKSEYPQVSCDREEHRKMVDAITYEGMK